MTWAVYVKDLLLAVKGELKDFDLAGADNIKPVSLVPLLENKIPLVVDSFLGNGLNFFQLGV